MIRLLLPMLFAAAAGAGVVLQQAINSHLRFGLGSAAWAGLASFVVGTVCMLAFVLATRDPVPAAGALARLPLWAWSGGVLGAIFIAASILLVPKLGAATLIACIVAGQMIAAVLFDQFGLLGLAQRSIDAPRLIGMAMLIGGVILIRR
jgi:transporter family-2 protein